MTSILAKELRGRNITVNAIAPGPTATKLFLNGKPPEVIAAWRSWRRWSVWASPRTSPTPLPSWPGRTAPGSMARPYAPTAEII